MRKLSFISLIIPIYILFNFNIVLASNQFYNFYVGAKIGYSHYLPVDTKIKIPGQTGVDSYRDTPSMMVGLHSGVRYKFIPLLGIRGELEYSYRIPSKFKQDTPILQNEVSLSIQTHVLLTNLYLDCFLTRRFTLYAGGGVGLSIIDRQLKGFGQKRNYPTKADFAYQVGAGGAYLLTEHIILDLNIRYVDFGTWKHRQEGNVRFSMPLSTVEAVVSLAYAF